MRNLAEARRWLNANGLCRYELTDAERARRVDEYAKQVAENGHIVVWLASPDQTHLAKRPNKRGRFRSGDAMLRHRAG
jgi:hypothetical protein